ncbi:hypothetical protein BM525_20305 (plasmid) [Alteromonas mediterranea]|uniref:Uncharacterized protein n=1 Tax=Alteromonas mediterranea TaxID=314275 RepID=A0AAC9NU68_9ALTE|nr:hypothetical protein [Alteromonas mediterranea]APD92222.1 hypothetical protein BM524_20110 [Alteromonas mediterranea]APE00077.1 hypothetical protein BM525_20305 [Alteromonas mediterranea]
MKMKNTHHNSERAAKSIGNKFDTLRTWIETGIPVKKDAEGNELFKNGEPVYIDIPTSLNKFLRWSDDSLGIMSTSQSALIKYLSTESKDGKYVEFLLRETKQKLQKQKLLNSSGDLKNQLDEAWKLINAQNKDITKYLSEIKTLKDEVKALTAEQENIELSAKLKMDALEMQVNSLNDQISRLRNMRIIDDK